LLDGSVAVADLPRLWNEKMTEYLGCTPADDAEGVLQACRCTSAHVRICWISASARCPAMCVGQT